MSGILEAGPLAEPHPMKKVLKYSKFSRFTLCIAAVTIKNMDLDSINGYLDHVHVLISLRVDQSPATVAQLLKGKSPHWLNAQLQKNTKCS
jgi:REP element-mobilizing transposase RayT